MEVIIDALKDTAIVFPFILIIYMLIELMENGTTAGKSRRALQGPLAPLLGSATGLVPQCGFSVMAAKLYDNGLIRTGTVLAVFLATSDEALIILLVNSPLSAHAAQSILPLILIKLLVAVAVGYLVNAIV
ncbi:MAG: arsenic efflux protein, partial [Clostridia bacterium]|nr:arsenic efflux protein [Clostridia bacterium]